MITFQVESEFLVPNGDRALIGTTSSYDLEGGAACQVTLGGVTAEVVVIGKGMLNDKLIEHHWLSMGVRVQPTNLPTLVGSTLTFP